MAATLGVFWSDFAAISQRVTSIEFLGISLVPIISIMFALFNRRKYLSFTASLRPNNFWGLLLFAVSLTLLFSSTYYESFSLFRSLALISFVLSLTLMLFNSFLVKLFGIPISTLGILLLPQMDLSVFSFIAFFSLILSILYSRAYNRIELTSCPDKLQKKMRGFTFCIRCGEVLRLPSKKMFQRDILVILLMAFLTLITLVIQVPIFSIYSDEPTIRRSSLYSYEDKGLFDTSGYLGSDRILDSQYLSYYIENMGANATLVISFGNISFVDEEFKVISLIKL